MFQSTWFQAVAALALVCLATLLVGCATRGVAWRPTGNAEKNGDLLPSVSPGEAWYIESKPKDGSKPYSCSFVEFDERGDYLDFKRRRRVRARIKKLICSADREALP